MPPFVQVCGAINDDVIVFIFKFWPSDYSVTTRYDGLVACGMCDWLVWPLLHLIMVLTYCLCWSEAVCNPGNVPGHCVSAKLHYMIDEDTEIIT